MENKNKTPNQTGADAVKDSNKNNYLKFSENATKENEKISDTIKTQKPTQPQEQEVPVEQKQPSPPPATPQPKESEWVQEYEMDNPINPNMEDFDDDDTQHDIVNINNIGLSRLEVLERDGEKEKAEKKYREDSKKQIEKQALDAEIADPFAYVGRPEIEEEGNPFLKAEQKAFKDKYADVKSTEEFAIKEYYPLYKDKMTEDEFIEYLHKPIDAEDINQQVLQRQKILKEMTYRQVAKANEDSLVSEFEGKGEIGYFDELNKDNIKIPFLSNVIDGYELQRKKEIMQKINKGMTLTDNEQQELYDYRMKIKEMQARGFSIESQFITGINNSVGMGLDFANKGVYALSFAAKTYNYFQNEELKGYIQITPKGDEIFRDRKHTEGYNMLKAIGYNAIQDALEYGGGKILGKVLNKVSAGRWNLLMGKLNDASINKFGFSILEAVEKYGWDGFLSELIEEGEQNIVDNIFEKDFKGLTMQDFIPFSSMEEFGLTTGIIAATGGIYSGATTLMDKASRNKATREAAKNIVKYGTQEQIDEFNKKLSSLEIKQSNEYYNTEREKFKENAIKTKVAGQTDEDIDDIMQMADNVIDVMAINTNKTKGYVLQKIGGFPQIFTGYNSANFSSTDNKIIESYNEEESNNENATHTTETDTQAEFDKYDEQLQKWNADKQQAQDTLPDNEFQQWIKNNPLPVFKATLKGTQPAGTKQPTKKQQERQAQKEIKDNEPIVNDYDNSQEYITNKNNYNYSMENDMFRDTTKPITPYSESENYKIDLQKYKTEQETQQKLKAEAQAEQGDKGTPLFGEKPLDYMVDGQTMNHTDTKTNPLKDNATPTGLVENIDNLHPDNNHIFISGQSGKGKSNMLRNLIYDLLIKGQDIITITNNPADFSPFQDMIDILVAGKIIQDGNMKKAITDNTAVAEIGAKIENILNSRFAELQNKNYANFKKYNENEPDKLNVINLVLDEFQEYADVQIGRVETDLNGNKVVVKEKGSPTFQELIERVAKQGRKLGINIILATQKSSASNISSEIRSQFGTNISLGQGTLADYKKGLGIDGTPPKNFKTYDMRSGEYVIKVAGDYVKAKTKFIDTDSVLTGDDTFEQKGYHGTSAQIEQFDWLAHALEGEGAMIYGAGTYISTSKKSAKHYQQLKLKPLLTEKDVLEGKQEIDPLSALFEEEETSEQKQERLKEVNKKIEDLSEGNGIYEVDIPEDNEMLDWNRQLNLQPKEVQEKIKKLIRDIYKERLNDNQIDKIFESGIMDDYIGESFYKTFIGKDYLRYKNNLNVNQDNDLNTQTSLLLYQYGIKGIKYVGERGNNDGKGVNNYVIFNDKEDVKILKKYKNYDEEQDLLFQSNQPDLFDFEDIISEQNEQEAQRQANLTPEQKAQEQAQKDKEQVANELGLKQKIQKQVDYEKAQQKQKDLQKAIKEKIADLRRQGYLIKGSPTYNKQVANITNNIYVLNNATDLISNNAKINYLFDNATDPLDIERPFKFMNENEVKDFVLAQGEQIQTNTPQFKNWFGNSKVVDENGEPLVVYHGSKEKFDIFNTEDYEGTFFTDNINIATSFSNDMYGNEQQLYKTYLSIQNPLVVDFKKNYYNGTKNGDVDGNPIVDDIYLVIEEAKEKGHDGVIAKNIKEPFYDKEKSKNTSIIQTEYIVFSPNQIKSATDNNGEFSTENDNIFFQGETEPIDLTEQFTLFEKMTDKDIENQLIKLLNDLKNQTFTTSDNRNISIDDRGVKHIEYKQKNLNGTTTSNKRNNATISKLQEVIEKAIFIKNNKVDKASVEHNLPNTQKWKLNNLDYTSIYETPIKIGEKIYYVNLITEHYKENNKLNISTNDNYLYDVYLDNKKKSINSNIFRNDTLNINNIITQENEMSNNFNQNNLDIENTTTDTDTQPQPIPTEKIQIDSKARYDNQPQFTKDRLDIMEKLDITLSPFIQKFKDNNLTGAQFQRLLKQDVNAQYDSFNNIIMLFGKSNPSSLIHEFLGHFMLNAYEKLAPTSYIAQNVIDKLKDTMRSQGKYNQTRKEIQEFFAENWEAYLRDGITGHEELAPIFEKFKKTLQAVYKNIKDIGSRVIVNEDMSLSEDVRRYFENYIMTTTPEYGYIDLGGGGDIPLKEKPIDLTDDFKDLKGKTAEQKAIAVKEALNVFIGDELETKDGNFISVKERANEGEYNSTTHLEEKTTNNNNKTEKKQKITILQNLKNVINKAIFNSEVNVDFSHNQNEQIIKFKKEDVDKFLKFNSIIKIGNDYFDVDLTTAKLKNDNNNKTYLYDINLKKNTHNNFNTKPMSAIANDSTQNNKSQILFENKLKQKSNNELKKLQRKTDKRIKQGITDYEFYQNNNTNTPYNVRFDVMVKNNGVREIYNFNLLDKKTNKVFNQDEDNKKRKGKITLTNSLKDGFSGVITLFKNADLSTINHELMHWSLGLSEAMASRGNVNAINDVLNAKKLYIDITGKQPSEGLKFSVDEQEFIAREYEAYLFNGETQNKTIQPLLQKIKSWFKTIYSSLTELQKQSKRNDIVIDNRIRDFFDNYIMGENVGQQINESKVDYVDRQTNNIVNNLNNLNQYINDLEQTQEFNQEDDDEKLKEIYKEDWLIYKNIKKMNAEIKEREKQRIKEIKEQRKAPELKANIKAILNQSKEKTKNLIDILNNITEKGKQEAIDRLNDLEKSIDNLIRIGEQYGTTNVVDRLEAGYFAQQRNFALSNAYNKLIKAVEYSHSDEIKMTVREQHEVGMFLKNKTGRAFRDDVMLLQNTLGQVENKKLRNEIKKLNELLVKANNKETIIETDQETLRNIKVKTFDTIQKQMQNNNDKIINNIKIDNETNNIDDAKQKIKAVEKNIDKQIEVEDTNRKIADYINNNNKANAEARGEKPPIPKVVKSVIAKNIIDIRDIKAILEAKEQRRQDKWKQEGHPDQKKESHIILMIILVRKKQKRISGMKDLKN